MLRTIRLRGGCGRCRRCVTRVRPIRYWGICARCLRVNSHPVCPVSWRCKTVRDSILGIKQVPESAHGIVDLDDLDAPRRTLPACSPLGIATPLGAPCFLRDVRSIHKSLYVVGCYFGAVRSADDDSLIGKRCRQADGCWPIPKRVDRTSPRFSLTRICNVYTMYRWIFG